MDFGKVQVMEFAWHLLRKWWDFHRIWCHSRPNCRRIEMRKFLSHFLQGMNLVRLQPSYIVWLLLTWMTVPVAWSSVYFRENWKSSKILPMPSNYFHFRSIIGFIDRTDAENLLRNEKPGTFIVRFSDTKDKAISITYHHPTQGVISGIMTSKTEKELSCLEVIETNPSLKFVYFFDCDGHKQVKEKSEVFPTKDAQRKADGWALFSHFLHKILNTQSTLFLPLN